MKTITASNANRGFSNLLREVSKSVTDKAVEIARVVSGYRDTASLF